MHLYKLIHSVNSACDKNINELKKLYSKHKILGKVETLRVMFSDHDSQNACTFSVPESKTRYKKAVMLSLFKVCCEECEHDTKELLFFLAAAFDIPKLREVIKLTESEDLNQIRFSDSVIVFTLKYGDVGNENFIECMKILIDAGVDINRCDVNGRFAIDYVASLYNRNVDAKILENLRKLGKLLLYKKICEPNDATTKCFIENDLQIDLISYNYALMDHRLQLFFWISKYKTEEFLSFKKIDCYSNCDNGENTLLQFAVNKSQNMLPIVEFLLKNGADPNKVTEVNLLSPLEISARNNYETIFKAILNWKETRISEEQFSSFVKARGYSIKRELFAIFLESDKIDPTFVYQRTGNTPLHYAIRLCHKNAIQKLLRRPDVCLTVKNKAGKCPLDLLNPTDLNIFLDSCLVFDSRRTIDFNSTEYTMQFRFRRLTDGNLTEVDVISLIGKYHNLEQLLSHPLIHTYVMLKWFKVKFHFWMILFLQAIIFFLLSFGFYRFPYSSLAEHIVCFCVCIFNIGLKSWVFLRPKDFVNDLRALYFRPTTLHETCEILLMVTSVASFYLSEFRAFIFVEMAIIFLLTAGYHPKLAHWSIMIQRVFRTFTLLLIFFSLLMIAFAASFHIMFEDHRFFTALYRSVFMAYFMTIGEINISEVDFETTPFGGYLLFFLFAMSMSVVIINFWTGVAIRDIDKFEERSEVNALKNVIAFISFIEKHVFSVDFFKRFLPNPLLFPVAGNEDYIVDFFVNKDDHFEYKYEKVGQVRTKVKRNFPRQLNKGCLNKIKQHYYKQQGTTSEQKILAKLDRILQFLDVAARDKKDLVSRIYKRENTIV
ncbi:hypothetical protein Zmor_011412 [Zophobas morio]|uniref:Uncharacterized protein n=1 Tax=Zophobas morio TaxID=2755281 RepID=A0AA38ML36_9CUCU|nr:hypothetical protein Zmor_011412 [Zophobas morio]